MQQEGLFVYVTRDTFIALKTEDLAQNSAFEQAAETPKKRPLFRAFFAATNCHK